MNIAQQAKEFAIKAHGNQKYGKMPYVYHLQQVVNKLIDWRDLGQLEITDEHLAVAWLHDVLEDTNVSYQELSSKFDEFISDSVLDLSKNYYSDLDNYISDIKENTIARLVKMADTMCNLEASILSGEMKRINKYSKQLALLTE